MNYIATVMHHTQSVDKGRQSNAYLLAIQHIAKSLSSVLNQSSLIPSVNPVI